MTRGAWCLAILLIAPATVTAQPLELHLTTPGPRCRTAAPMIIFARLKSPFGQTFHGNLHLMCFDQGAFVLSWQSPAIVLTGGEQVHRYVLPPMMMMNIDGNVTIRATFVPRRSGESMNLGEHVLPAPNYMTRNGVIAVSDPWGRSLPRYTQTIRSLRLDRFDPADSLSSMVHTIPSHVPARAMPADALSYCPFDIVALLAEGFVRLEPAQLDAIAQWTRAGGSVYVAPGMAIDRLNPAHRRFLRDMGSDGLNHIELGRAVIDHRPLEDIEQAADGSRQREVAAFLWKLSQPQRDAVISDGRWRTDLEQLFSYQLHDPVRYMSGVLTHRINDTIGSESLASILEPGEVRIIPFKVIALLMIGFVLAVGPADYLLLGALRKRKWTWLLFPVVTAAFTWATVAMSNRYIGRSDHRRSMTLVDVGSDNRALRETRLEMTFTGVTRDVVTERHHALFTPLEREVHAAMWRTGRFEPSIAAATHYEGRIPFGYTTRRRIEQWSPQFTRTTVIAPDRDVPIDFGDGDLARLQSAYPDYHFRLITATDSDAGANRSSETFINQLTVRHRQGFFSVVSQVSPTGGGSFEDLAIIDSTNAGEYVIIAFERRDPYATLYRYKFRAGQGTP
jgi:hypothetical protein